MLNDRLLCLIPAKASSRRFPGKNVALLQGRPLLCHVVGAARASGLFPDIYVSTEDGGVREIAESCGAAVPFMRPPELARDPAGVVDVALHFLDAMEERGLGCETLFILLPTCPLLRDSDITEAYRLYRESGSQVLMSVAEYNHTPFAALKIDGRGLLTPVFPEHVGTRSQTCPRAYRANGAVTILDVARFRRERKYYFYPLAAYVMPRERSVDIDTETDLLLARAIMGKGDR